MTYLTAREKKDDDDPQENDEAEDGDVVFDQTPVRVVCPHCGMSIITFIEHEASWLTYAVCMVLLLILNWAALCVVPVVYPLFKDVVHHCPRCLSVLATRSRVAISSFKAEIMSFRFGSCVIVLARKYVLMLLALTALIGSIHFLRSSSAASIAAAAPQRGELVALGWEDFLKDCGFKSYLGNPIHVAVAFNEKYKNKTFHWQGTVHHVEEGISLLWWSQRGSLYVRMQPPQFPSKRDMPDLVLLYSEGGEVDREVRKLKTGATFSFEATMLEVGKRGVPHTMAVWELHRAQTGANESSLASHPRGSLPAAAAGGLNGTDGSGNGP